MLCEFYFLYMTKRTKDLLTGFIPSLILPLVSMSAFIYFCYEGTLAIFQVIEQLIRVNQLSALLAIGAIPNLILFFYAMYKENWDLGRGVFAATCIYGALVMYFKM